LPFLVPGVVPDADFAASLVLTAVAFCAVGAVKGLVLGRSAVRSGLETLAVGGAAAVLAYYVGAGLRGLVGAGP
jgi:VIT1/CCC1 family predicted Fe2+/Mn2+ transporter